jgi:diaminopimelate decarboxylase
MSIDPKGSQRAWPKGMEVSSSDRLVLDGCDLLDVAEDRGTPVWAISRAVVEDNFHRLLSGLCERYANCEVAYAMKCHSTLAVVRLLHGLGAKMDCHPEYEYQLALHAGVPAQDIIINGNGKSDRALRAAALLGVRQVNVDSLDEALRLNAIAEALGVRVACTVRVKLTLAKVLELDPNYAPMVRLGGGKVGSPIASGEAMACVDAIVAASNLDFVGLHHHDGFGGQVVGHDYTVERELMHNEEFTREVCLFANEVQRRHGVQIQRLDLGGGFRTGEDILLGTPGEDDASYYSVPTVRDYAEAIFGTLEAVLETTEPPLVQFESGGHQVADAVVLLAGVCEVKDVQSPERRRYVVPDAHMLMFTHGGMSASKYPIVPVQSPLRDAVEDWPVEVAGQSCMYDTITEGIRLPEVGRGDTLAILHQGAYCEVMSTQMNAFPRPEVVLLDNGRWTVVKRREHIGDVWARNIVPPELWATSKHEGIGVGADARDVTDASRQKIPNVV